MASWKTFTQYPVFGKGVGQDACEVRYLDLSGNNQYLTDAHNMLFNVAAQEGVFGIIAVLLISVYFIKRLFPLNVADSEANVIRIGLAIALVNAFVYQGLSGSFEDARHLWVLTGFLLAADGIVVTN